MVQGGVAPTIKENGDRSHYKWWLLAFGFLGIVAYSLQANAVFPFTSIELKMPRTAILDLCRQWCTKLGYSPHNTVDSTVFDYDDDTKTFLEYQFGLNKANQLMKSVIPTWYWSTRFCRPFKLEEVNVSLDPSGNLISISRNIRNDRALPSISADEAKKLSNDFITKQAGFSLDGYNCIEDGTVPLSHRTDHYFTFEDTRNEYGGARLRVYTYVSGNILTEYKRFLFVPELWSRKFEKLRSYNRSLQDIASVFYVVFSTASFFTFLWAFAGGLLRWRLALSIAAVITAIEILESVNSIPALIHNYTTTMSLRGYFFEICISAGLDALQQLLQTFMIVGAGEALYRRAFPQKIALEKILTRAGLAAGQTLDGLIAGCGMFGVHLGWIILYYLAGKPLGFWSPMEIRNIDGLSNFFPYFSALYIGATAAILEEFTYRVLGLCLLQKVIKRFWLANFLQAVAWAFMHSNYPQEPPYARGLELTVVGLLYGAVLRRYGLIACLTSHYIFDVFLGICPLWSSPLLNMKLGSLLVLAPPVVLLVAAIIFRRYSHHTGNTKQSSKESSVDTKEFLGLELSIANLNVPVHAPAPPVRMRQILAAKIIEYAPLSINKRVVLTALAIIFAAVEFGFYFATVGDNAQLNISRNEAVVKARDYLIQKHLIPGNRIPVAWLSRDIEYDEMQYLFENSGLRQTRQLADCPGQPMVWYVRFFHPLDETEYWVTLDPSGRPLSLGLVRPEDAPGGRPDKEWSVKAATDYLSNEHKELIPFHQDSYSSIWRKARTDATVIYDVPKFHVGEAPCKVALNTIGNIVCNYNQYWMLPESWKFERAKITARQHIFGFVTAALWLIFALVALWWIIILARRERLNWKAAVFLAAIVGIVTIPRALNDLPELFVNYDTQLPLISYFCQQGAQQILSILSSMAMIGGLLLFSLASFHRLYPEHSFASILHTGLISSDSRQRRNQFNFWMDAVLIGYAAGLGLRAIVTVLSYIHTVVSPTVSVAPLDGFCSLANVYSSSLNSVVDALISGVQVLLGTGLLAGFCAKYLHSFKRYVPVILVLALVTPMTEKYWQDYLLWAVDYLAVGLLAWPVVVVLARENFIAYFLIGSISVIAANTRLLLMHGHGFHIKDIITLSLILLSPLIYVFMLWHRNRNDTPQNYLQQGKDTLA